MSQVALNEWFEHVRHFQKHKDEYPADVQAASEATGSVLFASPDEVMELTGKIRDLLEPLNERIDHALRPPGVVPMETLVLTHLVPPEFVVKDERA